MAAAFLVFLSAIFVVTHLGMPAEPYRSKLVGKFGEMGYKGIYMLISVLTLGGAIWFFIGHRHAGAVLWNMPWIGTLLALVLMAIAVPLIVFGFANPSPTGMVQVSYEPRGILHITRHPQNMGFAAFGLAHVLANGYLGDVALFGSIVIVGLLGAFLQDRRKSNTLGAEFAAFKGKTSIIPFAAIISGKTSFTPKDLNKPLLIACGIIYLGLIIFHGKLFGVSVF